MNQLIMKCIHGLGKAMQEKDSDEIKLKQDQAQREEMKKNIEQAKEKTDDMK